MKPRKPTLAECLRDEMLESGTEYAWAGLPDLMLAAYQRSGGVVVHPLNRIKAVVNAADRSILFEKQFIRACDSAGRREILHPLFSLRSDV